MRAPDSSESGTPEPPNTRSTVVLLLTTMADTTWRMFAPTLGLAALGLWADAKWHSGPLWSLVGVFTGIVIAAFLIRQQFRNVNK